MNTKSAHSPKANDGSGKSTLAPKTLKAMAERWLAGVEMKEIAAELGVSWQTLAGHLIAGGYRAKDRAKAIPKTDGPDWIKAAKKAAKTHKWSIIMTRWLVSSLRIKPKWNLV